MQHLQPRRTIKHLLNITICLYVTTFGHDIEFRRGLVDPWSSLNILPLSMLEAMGIPRDHVVDQLIEVSGFSVVGPIPTSTLFHIIDARTSYQLLFGRLWIHKHCIVPSTYHQRLKERLKRKKSTCECVWDVFPETWSLFLETAFIELLEDGQEVIWLALEACHYPNGKLMRSQCKFLIRKLVAPPTSLNP